MDKNTGPETLLEAIRYFSDPDKCLAYMVGLRWPEGVTCPTCGSRAVSFLSTRRLWKCREDHPRRQFSIKVNTVFEDSPIGLDKWLPAMWLLVNAKNGISSYEVGRALGVTQRTAWFMLHRIRLVVQTGTFLKMKGEVEADETFIGGAARFMHKGKKAERLGGKRGGMAGKIAVMGLLERHGPDKRSQVRLSVIRSTRRGPIQDTVRRHVSPGAELYTDALPSYAGLSGEYVHKVIDHAEKYAEGKIHTNGLENFWSLLKRSIKGTYVSVEPFHLFRYLDEQAYRFNERGGTDRSRFVMALRSILGKRLTYASLTAAVATT